MYLKPKIKLVLLTFVIQFLITSLVFFKAQTSLINPTNSPNKIDKFKNEVLPKLKTGTDQFQLNYPTNLIPIANAAAKFEEANSYLVVDFQSGKVILEKNSQERYHIASITKVMTAMVALDLMKEDQLIKVSDQAASVEPTKMGVIPHQSWSVKDLVTALLLTSANDAAEVLREGVDQRYPQGTFVKAMNEKSKFLGLKSCNFNNPQGLDSENNLCTASDIAIMTHFALVNYPLIKEIVGKDYQFIPASLTHKQADLYNWNGLLGVYPGVSGVKIGNTGEAGYTTAVLSQRQSHQVLVILLGAQTLLERDLWASQLLDLGFEREFNLPPVQITESQLKDKYQSWHYFN